MLKIGRVLLVAIVLALAPLAGVRAAGESLSRFSPERALQLDANNPSAIIARIDLRLLNSTGTDLDSADLARSGKRVLKSTPLSAPGLRLLGLAADLDHNRPRARTLMAMGNRISRRDFLTHVWMIEDRAAADDISGALDSYDLALSTSGGSSNLLFPVLSGALGDPQIRSAFLPYMARKRPWMKEFLQYAVTNSPDPQDIAEVLIANGGLPAEAKDEQLEASLLRQLAVKGQFSVARRYGEQLVGAKSGIFTQIGFSEQTLNPRLTPLAWLLTDEPNVRARQDSAGKIAVIGASNVRGLAAVRILFLSPGTYQFKQTVSASPQMDPAPLAWELRCMTKKVSEPIWQQIMPTTSVEKQYLSEFAIPSDCGAQQLSLIVSARDSQLESGALVGPLALKRVSSKPNR